MIKNCLRCGKELDPFKAQCGAKRCIDCGVEHEKEKYRIQTRSNVVNQRNTLDTGSISRV